MSNSKFKAQSAFKKPGAATLIIVETLLVFFTACKHTGGSGGNNPTPAPSSEKTYTVDTVSFIMKGIEAVKNGSIGYADVDNNGVHTVNLSPFFIGETEVTQELWQAVMGENPSWFDGSKGKEAESGEEQKKRPVERVNWYQCIVFCNELTKKVSGLGEGQCVYYSDEGHTALYTKDDAYLEKAAYQKMDKKGFRLPTEAEWEWVAKGGNEHKWAGTNEEAMLKDYAWYKHSGEGSANDKSHEVKKKKPNGYGLYDMSGNVWEWCWDYYSDNMPEGGQTDPNGVSSGDFHVSRGGSWEEDEVDNLSRAVRNGDEPESGGSYLGLRLAQRP